MPPVRDDIIPETAPSTAPQKPSQHGKKPYANSPRSPKKLTTMFIPSRKSQLRRLQPERSHNLWGEGVQDKPKPPPQESAVQRLFLVLNAMEQEANNDEAQGKTREDLNTTHDMVRHNFRHCAFQRYLQEHGWVRNDSYKFISEDIQVYDQTRHNPEIHGDVKRLVIVSPEGALAADRFVKNERRGKKRVFIVTPSLWTHELSTKLGSEPFFLFYRHGDSLQHLKYYGRCRLYFQQDHLSEEDWNALNRLERRVVEDLLRKIRHLNSVGLITSPIALSNHARDHSRIYIIERDGQSTTFFRHARSCEAQVPVTPDEIVQEANGSRRLRH